MTTRIRDIARDLDSKRIRRFVEDNRFRWSLDNFDKNLAALEKTLANLKLKDCKFYE